MRLAGELLRRAPEPPEELKHAVSFGDVRATQPSDRGLADRPGVRSREEGVDLARQLAPREPALLARRVEGCEEHREVAAVPWSAFRGHEGSAAVTVRGTDESWPDRGR